ncbi:hypothetical protein TNCV_4867021 [Trichonephila clavipes]|nr:hypothetical protein TNCV_4867021 [Trichonephila clavipes]
MPNCRRWPRVFAIFLNAGSALVENPSHLFVESFKTAPSCMSRLYRPQFHLGETVGPNLYPKRPVAPTPPAQRPEKRPVEPERIPTPPAQRPERIPTPDLWNTYPPAQKTCVLKPERPVEPEGLPNLRGTRDLQNQRTYRPETC